MTFEKCIRFQISGNIKLAKNCYKKLIENKKITKKELYNSYCNLAIICNQLNQINEAIFFFNNAIKINPKSEIVYNHIGNLYAKIQNYDKAIFYFSKSLKINNKEKKTYFNMGLAFEKKGDISKGLKNYKLALKYDPEYASANCNLGNLYYIKGDLKKAKQKLEKSIIKNPKLDAAFNNLGLIDTAYGNFKSAKKNFLKTIKINSQNSRGHYNLSSVVNYKDKKNNFHFKEMLENEKKCKSEVDKMYYSFAIGKAFEDIKEYKKSFNKIRYGNKIRRNSFDYSINKDRSLFKNIKKIYNKKSISELKNLGFNSNSTIFIVGMPRSGTSLVEQILSSHPKVFGAGEINNFEKIMLKYYCKNNNIRSLLSTKNIKKEVWSLSAKEYCANIRAINPSFDFITNKLTLNFRWLGLINIILPNAKIIHCKRNPIDTCLSIFQKIFPVNGNEYTFNLNEIAEYYKLYMDLFVYWKKIIPNSFYEIKYENLIQNQEKETRKLLDYCNITWNKKCLNFSSTNRAVRTSSDAQVRKNIYTSSSNRWMFYKNELSGLIETFKMSNYFKKNIN